jgi:hypothetical protein
VVVNDRHTLAAVAWSAERLNDGDVVPRAQIIPNQDRAWEQAMAEEPSSKGGQTIEDLFASPVVGAETAYSSGEGRVRCGRGVVIYADGGR